MRFSLGSLWWLTRSAWRVTTFPELVLRPLVMSLWVRKTFLNEHPVLLLAARVKQPDRGEAGNSPSSRSDESGTASGQSARFPSGTDPVATDGTEATSRAAQLMSLIAAKQYLREPALVALLFKERIVAVEEGVTSPEIKKSNRTTYELAVIAELNHEAARIVGSPELTQSTGITLGRRLLDAGRPRRAVPAFLRSAQIARERNDAGGVANGLWLAGEMFCELGQYDRAVRYLSEAAEIGCQAGVRLEAVARTSLGQILTQRGEFVEAATALDAAVELCRRGVPEFLPNALSARVHLHLLQGQTEAALASIHDAVAAEKNRDSLLTLLTLLTQQAGILQFLGMTEDLAETSERILSLRAEKVGSDEAPSETAGHGFLANVLGRVREFRYKLDYERRRVQERREACDPGGHAEALATLGTTYGQLCDEAQVDSCFRSAVALFEQIGRRSVESTVFSQWAAAVANCGNIQRAIELQRCALEAAERMKLHLVHCELLAGMADLLIRDQRFDEAEDYCQKALAECDRTQWAGGRIQPTLRRADILHRRGGADAGTDVIGLLNQAVEISTDAGSIDSQVQSKIDLVRRLLARGDAAQVEVAQRHLESAQKQARTIGDPDVLRVVLMLCGQCEEAVRASGWQERSRQFYVDAIHCYCRQRLAAPAIRDEPFETPYRISLQAASQELFDRAMAAAERLGEVALQFWIAELKHAQVLAELIRGDYLFLMPPLDTVQQDRMPAPSPGEALLVYSLLRYPDGLPAGHKPGTDDIPSGATGGQVRGILALLKLPGPGGQLHRIQIPWDGTAPVDRDWSMDLASLKTALGNLLSRYETTAPASSEAARPEHVENLVEQQTLALVDDWRGILDLRLQQYRNLLFPDSLQALCRKNSIQRLVIVPEGPLYHIPFPALRQSDGTYLIDQFEVVTVPCIALWQECRHRQPKSGEVPLMGIAEPHGSNLAGNGDAQFIGERIASCFAGSPRILSGTGATREQFLEAANAARVIHLMLHGAVPHEVVSGAAPHRILMAGESTGSPDSLSDSAGMTDEALFRLVHSGHGFPACRLMTMNVCFSFRTGQRGARGEKVRESHDRDSGEISGFPAAILALGVPTLIGSHWELYTDPGRRFFEEFYQKFAREGETAAAAYRSGVQAIRHYRGPDGSWEYPWFDNPYWWSSLALMGDGERRNDN